jgi:hypothetical protein
MGSGCGLQINFLAGKGQHDRSHFLQEYLRFFRVARDPFTLSPFHLIRRGDRIAGANATTLHALCELQAKRGRNM